MFVVNKRGNLDIDTHKFARRRENGHRVSQFFICILRKITLIMIFKLVSNLLKNAKAKRAN